MIHYTSVFAASLQYARHARAVLATCVRRVLALVRLPGMRVASTLNKSSTQLWDAGSTPTGLWPFSPFTLSKLNNAHGVLRSQVVTCVKQQLPGPALKIQPRHPPPSRPMASCPFCPWRLHFSVSALMGCVAGDGGFTSGRWTEGFGF